MSKRFVVTAHQREFELRPAGEDSFLINGTKVHYHAALRAEGHMSLLVNGQSYEVQRLEPVGGQRDEVNFMMNGKEVQATVDDESSLFLKSLLKTQHRATGTTVLRAPMPGLVAKIEVSRGEAVTAGQGTIILEAMKMENEIRSPEAGTIADIHVSAGTAVEKGTPLITIRHE
jgi:biotin carboxyl carrier protein